MGLRVLRRRILITLFLTLFLVFSLSFRLAWLQFWRGPELRVKAQASSTYAVPVQARRGDILDQKGRILAISMDMDSLWANPNEIPPEEVDRVAAALAPLLKQDEKSLQKKLATPSAFVWLQHALPDETATAIRKLELPGIHFTRETGRVYPEGMLAANLLGFATVFHAFYGVEQYYDKELKGKEGKILLKRDGIGREIPETTHEYIPPKDGLNLKLTIDATIQFICERELDRAMESTHAKAAYAVAMDPYTGAVLCLAQRPSFDPNHYGDYPQETYRTQAITDSFSPGSTFKPITAAAALEEGIIRPETGLYDSGAYTVLGKTIRNWNGVGLGPTTFATAFAESANTVFARLAVEVGKERFYRYLEKFGFTEKTGIDLPGEVTGIRPRQDKATDLDLAIMGFGQTLTVTPIQMAAAMSAAVNGGKLYTPHVAAAFLDQEGRVVKEIQPEMKRQVISEETSAMLRRLMARVVDEGTGELAQIPCYPVGGKTGTTQKVVGGKVGGAYIASFVGFAPVEKPRVVLYVAVDEPQGMYYGGQVAAPLFQAIMRDVLRYLDVPPQCGPEDLPVEVPSQDLVETPNLVNLPLAEALSAAREAGFLAVIQGDGGIIARQVPAAGAKVPKGTPILAYTDGSSPAEGDLRTVPDLRGQTVREAARILHLMGLRLEMDPDSTGVGVAQDPPPLKKVPPGTAVKVVFRPPGEAEEGSANQSP